jgi:hypothetical protein
VLSETIAGMEEDQQSSAKRIIAGGLFALFCALVIAALTVFGIISMMLGHIFMSAAGLVGGLLIWTEVIPSRPAKHKMVWTLLLWIIMGGADFWFVKYKEAEAREAPKAAPLPTQPQAPIKPLTSPTASVNPPTLSSPTKPGVIPPPQARLLMSSAHILKLKNKETGANTFGVNFFYANRGSAPTTAQVHKESVGVSNEILSREEVVRRMGEVSAFKALPELKEGGDEIYPNNPSERFFSMPDGIDKFTQLAPFFDDVMDGKKMVYFFVTIKFRDKSMAPYVVGVSQTCGWFMRDLDVVHSCGVDRLYSEVEK